MSDNAYALFIDVVKQDMAAEGADPDAITAAETSMLKAQMSLTGDRVGTIRIKDDTGQVATRTLREDGFPIWSVTTPGQEKPTFDLQPTLSSWRLLYEPPVPAEPEAPEGGDE